jgi:hypothetical protein
VHNASRVLVAVVAVLAATAACASSANGPANSPTPTTPATPTVTVPTSAAAPTSAPATASSSAPTTSAPATSSGTATHTSAPKSTCTSVTVRVLPGGASPGEEIAALQFTNAGAATCVLVGYPTVTLLLNGKQIGQASQPSTPSTVSSRKLAPGEVAESLVHDYTQTCQAPLSDSVKVLVPGSDMVYVRPQMQLRACILRVDKLGAPD